MQALERPARTRPEPTSSRAVENGHFSGPELGSFDYSSSNHLGYNGVQIVTVGTSGTGTFTGALMTTDDSSSGAVKSSSASPPTPPANGIPSD